MAKPQAMAKAPSMAKAPAQAVPAGSLEITDIEGTEKWLTSNGIKFHTIRHEISMKNE